MTSTTLAGLGVQPVTRHVNNLFESREPIFSPRNPMTKLLVLYYSTYGHVETLAGSIAEGAKSVDGVEVTIKRVPELMSDEVAAKHGVKLNQAAPIASPKELGDYDAIIFGSPTRFATWPLRCEIP